MGLKIPRSTTLAPPSPRLAVGTAQHRSFPRSLVHPPTSTPKPRAEGRVRAGGTQATSRPERERRPSPSAPAKKERQASACLSFFVVTGGEASARGACRASPPKRRLWRMQRGGDGAAVGDWQGGPAAADRAGHRKRACEASSSPSLHFRHAMEGFPPFSSLSWVFSPGFICLQPPPSPPAPRTHPVSPFSAQIGCVSLFLSSFDLQNFGAGFCASCRLKIFA